MRYNAGWTNGLIETVAYWLWQEDGSPDDDSLRYWYEAEKLLQDERIYHDPKYARLLKILRPD